MEQLQHDPRGAEDGWSYAKFVTENTTAARTLESLLQYSGFFAPVRPLKRAATTTESR